MTVKSLAFMARHDEGVWHLKRRKKPPDVSSSFVVVDVSVISKAVIVIDVIDTSSKASKQF